jgi:translation initiation factor IF-2
VKTPKGTDVVFFDTPGHEAFTALRARGAQTTDVAVLVVAADDGVMPTTVEAINHAKAARVPLVVVLNKMDKPDARPDRVLQELMRHEVIAEEFGGETLVVKVSAKTGAGIDVLLDNLALQTDVLELKANGKKAGVGTVFESKLDKGKGAVARVLVQEGVVRNGDVVLAGTAYGRIRAMFDDRGKPLDKAGPSTPVEILGLNEPPTAGDKMYVCADLRKAQEVAERLKTLGRKSIAGPGPMDINAYLAQQKDTQITVHVVIKADAQGAVEGLRKALTELSTDKVKVQVIHGAVGAITETDVQLAVASRAVIIGFNVRPIGKAGAAAEEQKIELRYYNVIYEAVDDIKALMLGQLKPTLVEKSLGRAEVRQVFNITKVGTIAGCMVQEGEVRRGSRARLLRDGAVKHDGRVGSLRRFKEDAAKVAQGFECGVGLENYNDLKPGDVIECYEHEEVAAQL